MDVTQARRVLGLATADGPAEARVAYRRLLRASHPDVSRRDSAGADTRDIIGAYRALLGSAAIDEATAVAGEPHDGPEPCGAVPEADADDVARDDGEDDDWVPDDDAVRMIADDTLSLACPAHEAFAAIVEVAHRIGDVTYLDRQAELLEALLRSVDGTTLSLVVSLQGRANGTTEAFLTLEPVDIVRGELPTIGGVTALMAHHLRSLVI